MSKVPVFLIAAAAIAAWSAACGKSGLGGELLLKSEMEQLYGGQGVCDPPNPAKCNCDEEIINGEPWCCSGENLLGNSCGATQQGCQRCTTTDRQFACSTVNTWEMYCVKMLDFVDCGYSFSGTCGGAGPKCGSDPKCNATNPQRLGDCEDHLDTCYNVWEQPPVVP